MTSTRPTRSAKARGFTLVEVLIAATLSAGILAAVVSSFLMLGRSGTNLGGYSIMEAQARVGLEQFAQDVRQASAITWAKADDITLTVKGAPIRYALVSNAGRLELQRNGRALITGVVPNTFELSAYSIADLSEPIPFARDANNRPAPTEEELLNATRMTKQLQLFLQASRSTTTVATATNTVISARFILRNRIVSS